ncbi:hypothetical protein HYV43_00190 [Candidatus Micrarchaeota archaeon]|nr:hypothetical protein [Candidatus Micrarchaeota archaeon]
MILERVRLAFADFPAQKAVAEKMLELGLSVRNSAVNSAGVQVKDVSLAQACGVDRRVVSATVARIQSDDFLRPVFESLQPAGPLFVQNASALGLTVLELEPPASVASKFGIVAQITACLARNRVPIRQILSQDPELFERPKLFIVLQKKPLAKVLGELSALSCVKKMSVY